MKLDIYARISTDDQSEHSLEAQVDLCKAWLADNDHQLGAVHIEKGFSAKSDDRPTFQKMMSRLVATDSLDGVLVHKYDRIFRNKKDAVIYKDLLRKNGKEVYSVSEPKTGNPMVDYLMESMSEMLAEYYIINLASETTKGMTAKAKKGEWPTRPPRGYIIKDGILVPDATEGPMVTDAFASYASGAYSLLTWSKEAWARGYRTSGGGKIHASKWNEVFRNQVYIGLVVWQGEQYQGLHKPLTDEETFARVNKILTERSSNKRGHGSYLLSGLLVSGVLGKPMSGNLIRKKYRYYRAMRGKKRHNVRCDKIEKQVIGFLSRVHPRPNIPTPEIPSLLRQHALAFQIARDVQGIYQNLAQFEERRALLEFVFEPESISVLEDDTVRFRGVRKNFEVSI